MIDCERYIIQYEMTDNIDTGTSAQPWLLNTVLAFLKYGMNCATVKNTHTVASNIFSLIEVTEALDVLWQGCDLDKPPEKRGSTNRSKCEALLTILLTTISRLDKEGKLPILVVDPIGLARLPKFDVEEISEVAIRERIRRIEMRMSAMEDTVINNSDDIHDIRDTLSSNDKQREVAMQQTADRNVTGTKKPKPAVPSVTPEAVTTSIQSSPNGSIPGASTSDSILDSVSSEDSTDDHILLQTDSVVVNSLSSVSAAIVPEVSLRSLSSRTSPGGAHGSTAITDYNEVEPSGCHAPLLHHDSSTSTKKRHITIHRSSSSGDLPKQTGSVHSGLLDKSSGAINKMKKGYSSYASNLSKSNIKWTFPKYKKRPKCVYGKSKNSIIKAAPEPVWDVFITGISKDISAEQLKSHLACNGVKVMDIIMLQSELFTYNRFHVRVPVSSYDKVLDGNLWEQGIRVSRYFTPKNNSN